MTLYIYRVEWTCPARNLITRSKSMKITSCTRTLPWPFRPVGRARPTIDASSDQTTSTHCQTSLCQFWSSTYAPLFFDKACVPKNTPLDQNYLRVMITNTSAIFCAKGDNKLSAMTYFSSSWWWNNLFWPPNFLCDYWLYWLDLHLLLHRFLLAQTLQPSLLSVRQAWGTPPWL